MWFVAAATGSAGIRALIIPRDTQRIRVKTAASKWVDLRIWKRSSANDGDP